MNYLAHSVLSFSDEQLAGNMMADFTKNNYRDLLPVSLQEGIKLHRAIDSFTDVHPAVSAAKKYFSPLVRLYSGAFVDVAFDYFTAHLFAEETLQQHALHTYNTLWKFENYFPENFGNMLTRMEADNWLYNYRNERGIEFSMKNVLRRARYLETDVPVFSVFLDKMTELQTCFDDFFPELKSYCETNFG